MFTNYQETVRCTPLMYGETLFITVGRGMGTTYALLSRAMNDNVVRLCRQGLWNFVIDRCRNFQPTRRSNGVCYFGDTRLLLASQPTPDILRGYRGEVHLDDNVSPRVYFELKERYPHVKCIVVTDPENFIEDYAPRLKGVYKILTWPWDINPYLEEANPRYKRIVIDQRLTGEWK